MLFTSILWILFLLFVFLIYHLVPTKFRRWCMLAASLMFYMSWSIPYVLLLGAHIIVDWSCGLLLSNTEHSNLRKLILGTSLAFNLGSLFVFKFYPLFTSSLSAFEIHPPEMRLVLPLGISFFAFESMSYSIDVFRGKATAWRSPLDLALFVTWFPHLIAGPIIRPSEMRPQLREQADINRQRFFRGLALMLSGFSKKMLIADWLARLVDPAFANPCTYNSLELAVAVYSYAFQIYCDFSAYTDIARGASLWFGLELPENFASPYLASSVTEFWRRWHMTLSRWLKDYVYIPLGGNRKGKARTFINLLATMLLGGLWHGASWTFVAWGGLHGVYLMLERILGVRDQQWTGVQLVMRRVLTFHLVCLGWIFFRAKTFVGAKQVISGILAGSFHTSAQSSIHSLEMVLLVSFYWACHTLRRRYASILYPGEPWSRQLAFMGASAAIVVCLIIFGATPNAFIYFQF